MTQKGYYFLGFSVAMFAYMAMEAIGKHLGIPSADVISQLLISALLVFVFPESKSGLGWGRMSVVVLISFSLFLCAVWTLGFWIWTTHSSNFEQDWRVIFPLVGVVVITPWFEEKLVRHLLLNSIDGVLGPLLSSILVSMVFAYAHKGVMIWAFIVSIALCWMRFRFKAKTAHCVIVHGSINAYVLLLYML